MWALVLQLLPHLVELLSRGLHCRGVASAPLQQEGSEVAGQSQHVGN